MLTYHIYDTSLGKMLIAADQWGIVHLHPADAIDTEGMERGETPLLRLAAQKLKAYLKGEGDTLSDLPLSPRGTAFQKQVWEVLRTVPYGETRSYAWLAQAIGKPRAARAVGGAVGKNTILLAIPCHRIIGANGSLVGFGGGLEMKKALLQLEGAL
jgi:O-6-methylguanine DNA methyltransferase